MGLLDSVLGSVMGGNTAQAGAGGGSLGSIIGALASNPQLLQAVTSMLGNDGGHGGLGGLIGKFEQAGLGGVIGSWVGRGHNEAISSDQLHQVLGSDAISELAGKLGINMGDTANQLAQILPGLVNHLTPQGKAPAGGLGDSGDLAGMLGGLLGKS